VNNYCSIAYHEDFTIYAIYVEECLVSKYMNNFLGIMKHESLKVLKGAFQDRR
jgi:hypothetical protein